MLLVLCPKILEEIINAENGAPLSPEHQKKKQFVDEVSDFRNLIEQTDVNRFFCLIRSEN